MAEAGLKNESGRSRLKQMFGLGTALPVIALLLSLWSFYTSEQARKDVAQVDVIKTEYGLFHQLAQLQLQFPMMEHLLTATEQAYDSNVATIKIASASVSPEDRAKLLLQERAIAHFVFTTYEETFYLWQESRDTDKKRAQMALDDLQYFNNALCSNPRLLWYWDNSDGGGLETAFAGDLRKYYENNVVKDCPTNKDPNGPFGARKETP
jgi:hypothetical protein